jgi:hypothetical protein
MHKVKPFLFIFFWFGIGLISCSKWDLDRIGFTHAITVGVIEVGASSAFLIGDIEGLRGGEVTETGFVYSSTAKAESNLLLGNNNVASKTSVRSDTTADRAFAVRVTGLEPNTSYSFRAYIKISGIQESIYGAVDSFSTGGASLSLLSFSRSNAGCPTTVTIEIQVEQSGPGGETTYGLIWSDSEENDSPTFQNGSLVTGTPDVNGVLKLELELECDKVYFVRGGALLSGGIPVLSDAKIITATSNGQWVRRSDFPGESRIGPYSFGLNATGHIGFGYNQTLFFVDEWTYDSVDDSWQILRADNEFGGTTFTIVNVQGEIFSFTFQYPSDVCKQNIQECSDCNFCICQNNAVWQWSLGRFITINVPTWPIISTSGDRFRNVGISISGRAYTGMGSGFIGCPEKIIIGQNVYNDFWEFTPNVGTNTPNWKQMDDCPKERELGHGFSINNFGYIGLGLNISGIPLNDFYRFDPSQPPGSQWQPAADFPNNYQHKGPGFTLKNKGYVLAADDRSSTIELWQFDPDDNPMGSWNRMPDLPASPGGLAQAHFVIDNNAYVYLDSIPDNFWMYVPEL